MRYFLKFIIEQIVKSVMKQDTGHDIGHLQRVYNNALDISQHEAYECRRTILAASYLHDIVNVPKDSNKQSEASKLSAEMSAEILKKLGYHVDEICQISHAIESHSFSANIKPRTTLAKIIQDADRLDAVGAVGIARVFSIGGSLGRPIMNSEDPFNGLNDVFNIEQSNIATLDIWKSRLLPLLHTMHTKRAKIIAKSRVNFMIQYLERLGEEVSHNLPESWRESACIDAHLRNKTEKII
jgi:uncharacterized protein